MASEVKINANKAMSINITGVNCGFPKRKDLDRSAPQLNGLYWAINVNCGSAVFIRSMG